MPSKIESKVARPSTSSSTSLPVRNGTSDTFTCTGHWWLVSRSISARSLARSGRAFLLDVFDGNDSLAKAVSRLLVLGFYLLSLGFVTLTMRTGGDVAGARAGLQLLSVKIGEVLLVIGVLPLVTLAALARTRRRAHAKTTSAGTSRAATPVQR